LLVIRGTAYFALFLLYFISTPRLSANPKSIMSLGLRLQPELQPKGKMSWMASGTAANFLDTASFSKGVVK
jgi:hypothetical protein